MREDCDRCGLHFERIEGHWIGAIGINTIVSFATLAISIIVGLIILLPDGSPRPLIVVAVVVSIAAPTVFFPMSRTLWTAIDIVMRPLEPHEVDWRVVDPQAPPIAITPTTDQPHPNQLTDQNHTTEDPPP